LGGDVVKTTESKPRKISQAQKRQSALDERVVQPKVLTPHRKSVESMGRRISRLATFQMEPRAKK
jgi:hypothetical protein